MSRKALIFSASIFFIAAATVPVASSQAVQAPGIINCEGPFAREATHADVVKAFGAGDVRYQKVQGAEGERILATVLYGGNAQKRLELIWQNEKARRTPSIRIQEKSLWKTSNGIGVGMTMSDIERLNGKPFKLSGFGWDYGGHVTDWNSGALSQPLAGGCHVDIDFYPAPNAPDAAVAEVSGEESFSSDNRSMQASKPSVGVIFIYYPVK